MSHVVPLARRGPTIGAIGLVLLTLEAQLLDAVTWVLAIVGLAGALTNVAPLR